MSFDASIKKLAGPILIVGAGGFVGANVLHKILAVRDDVVGTTRKSNAWRLNNLPDKNVVEADTNNQNEMRELLLRIKPATIFYLVSYGAYSFQKDIELTFQTNVGNLVSFTGLIEDIFNDDLPTLIHAGSSSEYGLNSAKPGEAENKQPDSVYSVTKNSASLWLEYLGRTKQFPCANLRLYSVYGPYEDSSRLIPQLVFEGVKNKYPPLVNPDISRDFVFVGDVVEAFVLAALKIKPDDYGQSYNIGSGHQTSIGDIATTSKKFFELNEDPEFQSMKSRDWDRTEWSADPSLALQKIGWSARTNLEDGFKQTAEWWQSEIKNAVPEDRTVKYRDANGAITPTYSHAGTNQKITAIIACYMDGQAIPFMYKRLVKTFLALKVDYEIIFVNDCSPDDSAEVIQQLSHSDPKVIGITHSRNYGSQNAFISGMEIASGDCIVLLDGDLQDPPELIEEFVAEWNNGHEVVYGHRVRREMRWGWEPLYKLFYVLFDKMSSFSIPRNAGDFSLIDRKVVDALMTFSERDVFLRGLRAYVGYRQTGVDYVRPERMFGTSTNNFWKNIDWAKKGIFSFSTLPLRLMTTTSVILIALFAVFFLLTIFIRIIFPEAVPAGLTTIVLLLVGFGTLNLLSTAILGEYIAKITEETKGRPRFIRSSITVNGQINSIYAHDAGQSMREIESILNKPASQSKIQISRDKNGL